MDVQKLKRKDKGGINNMPQLSFYDLKSKKKFNSDKYKFVMKNTKSGKRYFAVCNAPSGIKSWRIVGKDFYMKYK